METCKEWLAVSSAFSTGKAGGTFWQPRKRESIAKSNAGWRMFMGCNCLGILQYSFSMGFKYRSKYSIIFWKKAAYASNNKIMCASLQYLSFILLVSGAFLSKGKRIFSKDKIFKINWLKYYYRLITLLFSIKFKPFFLKRAQM